MYSLRLNLATSYTVIVSSRAEILFSSMQSMEKASMEPKLTKPYHWYDQEHTTLLYVGLWCYYFTFSLTFGVKVIKRKVVAKTMIPPETRAVLVLM